MFQKIRGKITIFSKGFSENFWIFFLLKNIILYNIKYRFGINESTSFSYSESSSSGTSPRKIRSLDDLYEVTNPFDDDGIRTTLILLRQDIVKRNKR